MTSTESKEEREEIWKCLSELRHGAGGWGGLGWVSGFQLLSGPAATAEVVWQFPPVGQWLHFLFASFRDPPSVRVRIVFSTSCTRAAGKVLYLVQEFCLLHPSAGRGLYFPAHWPGYHYKWEGNNVGWTAGSARNLLHICRFHGGLRARDWVGPSPLSRQKTCLVIHLCVFQGLNLKYYLTNISLSVSLFCSLVCRGVKRLRLTSLTSHSQEGN